MKLKDIPETLSLKIHFENEYWFAECPELKLMDQGKSMLEAITNLFNMMYVSLLSAYEHGTFEAMLKELKNRIEDDK